MKAELFSSGYATWSGKHEQFENVYHHDQKANSTAPSSTDVMLMKPDSFVSGYATWSGEPEL